MADTARNIVHIYAHSVHPGTVRLLRRLGFNDPQATGAPISDVIVDAASREAFPKDCESQIVNHTSQINVQCEFRRKGDKRARPWPRNVAGAGWSRCSKADMTKTPWPRPAPFISAS